MDVRPLEWSDYLRIFNLPPGLLANGNREDLHVTVAFVDDEPVSSALTFDFKGDRGIYTLAHLSTRVDAVWRRLSPRTFCTRRAAAAAAASPRACNRH
jgi:hypothetical protein